MKFWYGKRTEVIRGVFATTAGGAVALLGLRRGTRFVGRTMIAWLIF